MADNVQISSGGLPGLLAVLFIGLKLTGYINWSWWWVLPPIWISFGLVMGILGIILAIFLISEWIRD